MCSRRRRRKVVKVLFCSSFVQTALPLVVYQSTERQPVPGLKLFDCQACNALWSGQNRLRNCTVLHLLDFADTSINISHFLLRRLCVSRGGVSYRAVKAGFLVEMPLDGGTESHLDIECNDVKESFYGGRDYPPQRFLHRDKHGTPHVHTVRCIISSHLSQKLANMQCFPQKWVILILGHF